MVSSSIFPDTDSSTIRTPVITTSSVVNVLPDNSSDTCTISESSTSITLEFPSHIVSVESPDCLTHVDSRVSVSYQRRLNCPAVLIFEYLHVICPTHCRIWRNVTESSGLSFTIKLSFGKEAESGASATLQQLQASLTIDPSVAGYDSLLIEYG